MSSLMRVSFAVLLATASSLATLPALAQSGDPKAGEKAPQTTDADAQRRVDEFAEAARVVSGPAGNAECVWLGRRVVGLLWRDDMDTAFRHLDLYDRFGCPGPHIQAAFRCVVRQGNIDPKSPQSLNSRVHACWLNPSLAQAQNAPAQSGTAQATGAAPPAAGQASQPAPSAKTTGTTGK